MAYSGSNVFVSIGICATTPGTVNLAGFQGLTYTSVIGCLKWPGEGDDMNDIVANVLNGRVIHFAGLVDGGKGTFTFLADDADPGQILMRTLFNGTQNVSTRVNEGDGHFAYNYGLLANIAAMDRDSTTLKGFSGEYRINSPTFRV